MALVTVMCMFLDIHNTTQIIIYFFYKFAFRELTVYFYSVYSYSS